MTDQTKPEVEGLFSTLAMVVLGMCLAGLIFSIEIQDYRHEIGLGALSATFLAAAASKALEDVWRTGFLAAGVVITGLGLSELYFTLSASDSAPNDVDHTFSGTLSQTHQTLGYAPPTSTSITVQRSFAGKSTDVIYDVTYTLDAAARRVGPDENINADCILFFGGSFTWGEGVEDFETMPHQVAVASGHTLRAVNFGFSGYGAHHMLRAIDDGALQNSCNRDIRAVVYTAIPPHYLRSAGLVTWGPKSPRYRISEQFRQVLHSGPMFDDMTAFRAFRRQRESALVNLIMTQVAKPDALDLYAAIVGTAEYRIISSTGAPFVILYWDLVKGRPDSQLERLIDDGFNVIRVSTLLSRGQMTTMRIPGDGHPNAEAYKLLGHALYDQLPTLIADSPVAKAQP